MPLPNKRTCTFTEMGTMHSIFVRLLCLRVVENKVDAESEVKEARVVMLKWGLVMTQLN